MRNWAGRAFVITALFFTISEVLAQSNITVADTDPSIQYDGGAKDTTLCDYNLNPVVGCYSVPSGCATRAAMSLNKSAAASFSFYGTALYINSLLSSTSPIYNITLDGQVIAVDGYRNSPTFICDTLYSGTGLNPKTLHHVRLSILDRLPNGSLRNPNRIPVFSLISFIYTSADQHTVINIAPVVGGAIAGFVAIAAAVIIYLSFRRRRSLMTEAMPVEYIDPSTHEDVPATAEFSPYRLAGDSNNQGTQVPPVTSFPMHVPRMPMVPAMPMPTTPTTTSSPAMPTTMSMPTTPTSTTMPTYMMHSSPPMPTMPMYTTPTSPPMPATLMPTMPMPLGPTMMRMPTSPSPPSSDISSSQRKAHPNGPRFVRNPSFSPPASSLHLSSSSVYGAGTADGSPDAPPSPVSGTSVSALNPFTPEQARFFQSLHENNVPPAEIAALMAALRGRAASPTRAESSTQGAQGARTLNPVMDDPPPQYAFVNDDHMYDSRSL